MKIVKGLVVIVFSLIILACQSPKNDLRTLAPAETLIYLETNDLGQMLQTLTQGKSFQELSKSTPDFSSVKGMQIAVVVTGFETSEKQVTDESAVLNFKPRFALIADTHSWESTAMSIAENQIGRYVKENYGFDAKLDKGEKNGIRFFHWTATGNQKVFASVTGNLIFVGNDETIVDKCLAVKKGEAENLLSKPEFVQAFEQAKDEKNLAFGYISNDGVAQLGNLAGISVAIGTSEEDMVRSFIAKNLPVMVQKTAKEVIWTARTTDQGIEDRLLIKTDPAVSGVWKETLTAASNPRFASARFLPNEFSTFTRYNLQHPNVAWQSVLMTASKQLDGFSGKLLTQFSGALFTPYAISDGETFLSAVGNELVTARFDQEGDRSVVIAEIKDAEKIKKSISATINFKPSPEKQSGADLWKSEDKTLTAAFLENLLILGESESVVKCLQAGESGQNFTKSPYFLRLTNNNSVTTTVSRDSETAQKIVELLSIPKEGNKEIVNSYVVESRFDGNGIERRTVSDFGYLGMIIEQFGEN
jgi:hypothetical protein